MAGGLAGTVPIGPDQHFALIVFLPVGEHPAFAGWLSISMAHVRPGGGGWPWIRRGKPWSRSRAATASALTSHDRRGFSDLASSLFIRTPAMICLRTAKRLRGTGPARPGCAPAGGRPGKATSSVHRLSPVAQRGVA